MKIKVKASNMLPGDILCGSKEEVKSVSTGIRTPAGKIEVDLENPNNGKFRVGVWGRHTFVNVERE